MGYTEAFKEQMVKRMHGGQGARGLLRREGLHEEQLNQWHQCAIAPSFSWPRVSDDNPFSESLFRTLKYRPSFPDKPFSSLEEARSWVASFVGWYNSQHRYSAIRFVTPDDRHFGREAQLLARRHHVYQRARHRHPERWRGDTRDWTPAGPVRLNPSPNPTPAMPSLRPTA